MVVAEAGEPTQRDPVRKASESGELFWRRAARDMGLLDGKMREAQNSQIMSTTLQHIANAARYLMDTVCRKVRDGVLLHDSRVAEAVSASATEHHGPGNSSHCESVLPRSRMRENRTSGSVGAAEVTNAATRPSDSYSHRCPAIFQSERHAKRDENTSRTRYTVHTTTR